MKQFMKSALIAVALTLSTGAAFSANAQQQAQSLDQFPE